MAAYVSVIPCLHLLFDYKEFDANFHVPFNWLMISVSIWKYVCLVLVSFMFYAKMIKVILVSFESSVTSVLKSQKLFLMKMISIFFQWKMLTIIQGWSFRNITIIITSHFKLRINLTHQRIYWSMILWLKRKEYILIL